MTHNVTEPSAFSFRDPTGNVFLFTDHVERSCIPTERSHIRTLLESPFFKSLASERFVCQTHFIESTNSVWQELIDSWSYPYEWSFSMLRDAALLTLELQGRALSNGYSLKDAAAYNITFTNGRPIFADVYSFVPFTPSLSWVAYDQFCREFLNPLVVHSVTGISLSSILRGRLAGVTTAETHRLLSWRALFRRGMLLHLYLKQKLDSQYSKPGTKAPLMGESNQPSPDICLEVQRKLVRGLKKAITALSPQYDSTWESYTNSHSYQSDELQLKTACVKEFAEQEPGDTVIDYGCNTGLFSKLVAPYFSKVFSLDSDEACIEQLYRTLRDSNNQSILPLAIDLNNPPAAQGWENRERQSFFERIQAQAFLALALVHHMRFGNNVPVALIAQFFSRHDRGVVEYIAFEDPMVQHLLRHRKRADYADYEREVFVETLAGQFYLRKSIRVSATRELFLVKRH